MMVMGRRLAAVVALAALAAPASGEPAAGFESGVNVVLQDPNAARTCLTLSADGKNVVLEGDCSPTNAAQVWYLMTDGTLGTRSAQLQAFSDNAGALQAHPAGTQQQGGALFAFLAGDKIQNQQNKQCIGTGYFAPQPPTQFLKYMDCGAAPGWKLVAAAVPFATPQVAQAAPQVVQATPQVVQAAPQVVQAAPQVAQAGPKVVQATPKAPQVVFNGGGGGGPAAASAKSVLAGRVGTPSEGDHYLCTCIVSKDDDKCIEAVRAGCTVGHIPSELCNESFEKGNHDRISKHIVDMIQRGAKCPSSADLLRSITNDPAEELPVHRFHGQQMVTAEDHYLCVCLSSEEGGGDTARLDKQCEDAVRVACMVGHIPEPDCFASFDEQNHAQIVDRIMKMIDSGANCAKKLDLKQSAQCANPPCYKAARHSRKKEPHYLCVCMEDHQSIACKTQVERACKEGKIPKADCDVAIKADFRHAVTRHVMHLIDHGSECGLSGNHLMTFTNNRCHCKQEWKADTGEVLKWPDNCRDPGGVKGFSWCETYADEGCVGVGESMSWDRCDNPQYPRYHLGEFAQTSIGKITPVDHYLCVCIDSAGTDEGCDAAVRAGCMVGHIPTDLCAASFQKNDHAKMSDHILDQIANGARCNNIDIASGGAAAAAAPGGVGPAANNIAGGCGHGQMLSSGACQCSAGFAGLRCDYCADGYVGYPSCVPKRDCDPVCHYGTCDFSTGTCACPANRQGAQCELCSSGYSGASCQPAVSSGGWLGRLFLLGVISAGAYFCCCTPRGAVLLQAVPWTKQGPSGAYSRLSQDAADFFDTEDNVLEVAEDDGLALAGTDASAPLPSSGADVQAQQQQQQQQQPMQQHSGLAI